MGYDITPKPYAIYGKARENAPTINHLCELIDNSFDKSRGNATTVTITHNKAMNTLEVLDDGVGIDQPGRLFSEGDTTGSRPGDIGRFGAGGTKALHQMSSRASVASFREGNVCVASLDFDALAELKSYKDMPDVNEIFVPATRTNTPPDLFEQGSGTLVHMVITKQRIVKLADYMEDLSEIYTTGIESGKSIILHTVGAAPRILKPAKVALDIPEDVSGSIVYEGKTLCFTGCVGLTLDGKRGRPYIAISYGFKRIFNGALYIVDGGSGAGVKGSITLGPEWAEYLNTSKTGLNDDNLAEIFGAKVRGLLIEVLKRADTARSTLFLDKLATGVMSRIFTQPGSGDKVPAKKETRNKKARSDGTHTATQMGSPRRNVMATALRGMEITKQNNNYLNGALAQVTTNMTTISVAINKDNPTLEKAQANSDPTTLIYIILRELGEYVVSDEGHVAKAALFNEEECASILESSSPGQIATVILLTRVREP